MFAGDFNSNADETNPTYKYMIDSGFLDSFAISGEGEGFTCCEDPTLLNVQSSLDTRIDYVFFKKYT